MSNGIVFEFSKGQVNRAGSKLAQNAAEEEDFSVIENWRASHNYVLNTFQSNLRLRAKKAGVRAPVQRIKRLSTIRGKLNRFPTMQLARMHDVVGCRVVFDDVSSLIEFREEFNRSRFKHKRRVKKSPSGSHDAYNYITRPKLSGYRGIHDVFEYVSKQAGAGKSTGGSRWNGLLLEVQYRTTVQHAWATAVEICDNYTDNHGKFNDAPKEYLEYFQLASEVLARAHESMSSCMQEHTDAEIVNRFNVLENKHGMLRTLRGINPSDVEFSASRHTLLVVSDGDNATEVSTFANFKDAVAEYFRLERETDDNVVLVAADDSESVRFGFKNYFQDAREFVSLMDSGLDELAR